MDRRRVRDDYRAQKSTFGPEEYGRVVRRNGAAQWWIRAANGAWIALRHQRVIENQDGTITLLSLSSD